MSFYFIFELWTKELRMLFAMLYFKIPLLYLTTDTTAAATYIDVINEADNRHAHTRTDTRNLPIYHESRVSPMGWRVSTQENPSLS